jgi:hypothetical protein
MMNERVSEYVELCEKLSRIKRRKTGKDETPEEASIRVETDIRWADLTSDEVNEVCDEFDRRKAALVKVAEDIVQTMCRFNRGFEMPWETMDDADRKRLLDKVADMILRT